MKTLIVTHEDKVRFLVTNHPEYRFEKLAKQMPVHIKLFGVTDEKAKDIKLRFADLQVGQTEWFNISDEFQQFLARVIK